MGTKIDDSFRRFLKLTILTSHCIWLDLHVLGLAHPNSHIRDVALFIPFRRNLGELSQVFQLPTMIWRLMGHRIGQLGQHPVE